MAKQKKITESELAIVKKIVQGMTCQEIAMESGRSVKTIEVHTYNLRKKLQAKSMFQVVYVLTKYQVI